MRQQGSIGKESGAAVTPVPQSVLVKWVAGIPGEHADHKMNRGPKRKMIGLFTTSDSRTALLEPGSNGAPRLERLRSQPHVEYFRTTRER